MPSDDPDKRNLVQQQTGTSGIGTLSMHGPDATVRSTDSVANSIHSMEYCDTPKQEGPIKAYVDFTEFDRNYEEYMKNKQAENKGEK